MNGSFLYAFWICFIVVTPCIIGGITQGFPSIALPELQLSLADSSWFSCLSTVVAPFGCLMTGYMIDRHGRKPALILCVLPGMIGWLIIANHREIWQLFLGRIFTGLSSGASFFPAQVYMAEFIDMNPKLNHLRTSFTNWPPLATNFGVLLVSLLGAIFPYNIVAFMTFGLIFSALCCICIIIPESPIWLYQKGRYGDAEWSLKRLKVSGSFEHYRSIPIEKKGDDNVLSKLFRRDVYIPLFITTAFLSLTMLSGGINLSTYLVNMINTGGLFSLQSSYYLSVVSVAIQCIGTVTQICIITFTGIRKIALGSTLGLAVSMLIYGAANYFINSIYANIAHTISVVAIWFGVFCCGFGTGSIPRAILGELFPPDAKGFAIVPTFVMYIFESTVIKFHPYFATEYGGLIYFVYAGFSCINFLFCYLFLPETVGRTFKQINDGFRKKSVPVL